MIVRLLWMFEELKNQVILVIIGTMISLEICMISLV